MLPAPAPSDEPARLVALYSYKLLDTDPDSDFDGIVQRVARIFDAPIAALTLVDKDRQWFKSQVGLGVRETPRELSFCAHVILGDRPFLVEDARLDPRFASNLLVTDSPSIRFYAGVPLITRGGFKLGSLCAIKPVPHRATKIECKQLASLGRLAVAHMEMRRTVQNLAAHPKG